MIPPAVIILACLDLPLVAEMKTDKRERGREAGVEARAVGKDGGQMEPFVPSLFPGHDMPALPYRSTSAISQFVLLQGTAHRSSGSENSAEDEPGESPCFHLFIHSFIYPFIQTQLLSICSSH